MTFNWKLTLTPADWSRIMVVGWFLILCSNILRATQHGNMLVVLDMAAMYLFILTQQKRLNQYQAQETPASSPV